MNALQQRMMANAMSRTGMGLEEMSAYVEEEDPTHAELEGGAMGPVPATQRAKLIKYGRRHIPAIGPLKINSVLLSKEYGRTQDERNEWNADPANKKQKALLQKAYAARQMYSNLRNSGDPESFNKIINLKAQHRADAQERAAAAKAARGGRPAKLSANLRAAHDARQFNSMLRDALGRATADKYIRAKKAAMSADTREVFLDGARLADATDLDSIFKHRTQVISQRENKAERKPKRALSMKPGAIAARARNKEIREAAERGGYKKTPKVRTKKSKKGVRIVESA